MNNRLIEAYILPYKVFIIGGVLLLLVVTGAIASFCGFLRDRKLNKLSNQANSAANNSQRIQGEIEQQKKEIVNTDAERGQQNAVVDESLENVEKAKTKDHSNRSTKKIGEELKGTLNQ